MKEKKAPLIERVCRAIDIVPEAVSNTPYIELHGRTLLKIRNGGKILLYTPTLIKIALPNTRDTLSVCGKELSCSFFNMGAIGIEGEILTVTYLDTPRDEEKNK